MTAPLFTPVTVGGLALPNRIAVAPMCQYSANDGTAADWHLQHWMSLAMSGAGMITIEATGVERRGRISHACLGMYSDDNEAAAERALTAARRVAPHGTRFGIQLNHAGRKAAVQLPWHGNGPLGSHEDPWETVAPSAIPFDNKRPAPVALDQTGIDRVVGAFVSAAGRAVRAGFDFVELQGAHGYLLHEFLSPLSNQRTDQYGGSLENRMRLIVHVAGAVRAALPATVPLGVRLSATDWVDGGFNVDEAVAVSKALKDAGVAFVCASSGGLHPAQKIAVGPLYQVPFAERMRRDAGIATRAVGGIDDPHVANAIIADGRADIVALGRPLLADPRWPWRAAAALGAPLHHVHPYARSAPLIDKWVAQQPRPTAA